VSNGAPHFEIFQSRLTKPDGRYLILYSSRPIPEGIKATSPSPEPIEARPHMRWHPLRGEWVAYASHRQNRTFLPPKEFNPLAVSKSDKFPTELPEGDYDVAVFENLFPSLSLATTEAPSLHIPTLPAKGQCEVLVFTKNPDSALGRLPVSQINLLLNVWAERYEELGSRDEIKYILPFENRGVEMGVTLHHPHGQIYGYSFIPPVAQRQLEMQSRHFEKTGRSLVADLAVAERADGQRVIYEGPHVLAFVPACARYPYEVWIAPHRSSPSLVAMTGEERYDLAKALKTVLLKYDGLWNRAFPYLMVFHGAPTDGAFHPESHFHIELYPPMRTPEKMKYLAGTELGAGMFANDTLPEEKAAELKAVSISIEEG
jgi:UDPglucose--hexose-1-phosphate uridylyltransferase